MAASNFTPISLYYSPTAAAVPLAANLVAGELALNTIDGKLFYKDSSNAVQVLGTKGGVGTSSTTQVLYNNAGLIVGSANLTFSSTTQVLTAFGFAGPIGAATQATGAFTTVGVGTSTPATALDVRGSARSFLYSNPGTISANAATDAGFNSMSIGPVTIANGITFTVATVSRWVIN